MAESKLYNSYYQQEELLDQVHHVFAKENIVTLQKFLHSDVHKKCLEESKSVKWKKECKPMHYQYKVANLSSASPTLSALFKQKTFLELFSTIVGKKVKKADAKLFCLSWKDYSLRYPTQGIQYILDITPWNTSCGGGIVYTDDQGSYTKLPAEQNMLTFVKNQKGQQGFFQYVNHYGQGKKRVFVIGSLE
jgi:hypothetical protein